jgi:tryptophanyl-tRNA synthetase
MEKRILSGMRPTGKLHLGNYAGALENWVNLQGEYHNYHMVADWHALTTAYQKAASVKDDVMDMVMDWIAAGIDPKKSVIFVQSHIKEHAELHLLFSMLVTMPRLERNPTVKEMVRDLGLKEEMSYGLFGYPVLQAADILMYRAHAVPVGEDQAPHVELTREIARRFNRLFGDVFPEPKVLLTTFGRLPGLDGKRMSKSLGNVILLSDPPEVIAKKIAGAVTDPQKVRKGDPGRPEVCLVFTYHKKFNPSKVPEIESGCRSGELGCVPCKRMLSEALSDYLAGFRERRDALVSDPERVRDIIEDGDTRAREAAQATMALVRDGIGL